MNIYEKIIEIDNQYKNNITIYEKQIEGLRKNKNEINNSINSIRNYRFGAKIKEDNYNQFFLKTITNLNNDYKNVLERNKEQLKLEHKQKLIDCIENYRQSLIDAISNKNYSKCISNKDKIITLINFECNSDAYTVIDSSSYTNTIENIKKDAIKDLENKIKVIDDEILYLKEKCKSKNSGYLLSVKEICDKLTNDNINLKLESENALSLPISLCIGSYSNKDYPLILKEAYKHKTFNINEFDFDIKNVGNIIINANLSANRDNKIYDFISKISLKYLESFPLGNLKIHFIDNLEDPRFIKFINGFSNYDANDVSKGLVELSSDFISVKDKIKNKCRDMSSILSPTINDIYDAYDIDHTQYFDLVVIRNSLAGIAFNDRDGFDLISNYLSHNSLGYRCGVRFIVVNDVDFDDRRVDDSTKQKIEVMYEDNLVINYKDDQFTVNSNTIEEMKIESNYNIEDFIELKCKNLSKILKELTNKAITYEELGFDNYSVLEKDKYCSILRIPVGKSGSEIINIPFSCEDSDNSSEAKNIGLMVLGKSGSGKSSLYHSIILNGSMKYSPEDLQFWLLDFKSGAAASQYYDSCIDIPHVKIVAPNSKSIDAFTILKILENELEVRLSTFKEASNYSGRNLANLVDYNRYVGNNNCDSKFKHFPRIILMIDEVQEIFRDSTNENSMDDLPKKIGNCINKIVSLARSSGIHLAMFGQNLDAQKTYILKDNFINQLQFKACFRLAANSVTNSGYKGQFENRKDEIEGLSTGHIYLSSSNEDIKKCIVAFTKKFDYYKEKIRTKYLDYSCETLKIGETKQLLPHEKVPKKDSTYLNEIFSFRERLDSRNNIKSIICQIGEDSYSLKPRTITYSTTNDSNVFLVGSSKIILSSLLSSLLLGIIKSNYKIYLCNGALMEENMYNSIYDMCDEYNENIKKYKIGDIDKCIADVYREYMYRDEKMSNDEYICSPMFVFLNAFDSNNKVSQDVKISFSNSQQNNNLNRKSDSELTNNGLPDFMNQFNKIERRSETKSLEDIQLLKAIQKVLENGNKYNIYFIISLKSTWYREFEKNIQDSNNVIVFNEANYSTFANNYSMKSILADIKQDSTKRSITESEEFDDVEEIDNESFAVLYRKTMSNKFRPVIFKNDIENIKNNLEYIKKELVK